MDQITIKAERVNSWADGKPAGPVRIEIHPTNRCNLKCRFCWQSSAKPEDTLEEMSEETLFQIVEDAARMGVKEWIVSGGGEPFVRGKTTIELLRKIKQHGMWGQLTTNGTLITREWAREFVEMGWDQVQFSIDGPDAKTHDYLRRVPGTFDRATRAARWLSEARREKRATKPYLGFNTVITRRIHDKLPEMVRLGHDVGFDLVYFEPVYAGYVSEDRMTLNDEEKRILSKKAAEAKVLAGKLGVATNADRYIDAGLVEKGNFEEFILRETEESDDAYVSAPCYQPWYLLGIKGNGLAGCCSTFEVGEKVQEKSIRDIWHGELFNSIRRGMLSKNLPSYCAKCSVVVVMDNKDIRKELKAMRQGNTLGEKGILAKVAKAKRSILDLVRGSSRV